MAVDDRKHDPVALVDSGGIVRETAALADRSTKVTVHNVSVTDPDTGVVYAFPLVSDGRQFHDIFDGAKKWSPKLRLEGAANVETLASFIELVNRHKTESSAIFANLRANEPWLRAIIDYHDTNHSPSYGKHSVYYKFPISPEFKAWQTISGKALAQKDFSSWVEDHIHEVATPAAEEIKEYEGSLGLKFGLPHELVRVARGIAIHAELKVANIQTLATGESQIAYDETHTVKDSDNKPLKIPGLIMVDVPLFYGGDSVRLPFRLRYERKGPEVLFKLIAFRLERILLGALENDYDVATQGTVLPGFRGTPEMP